MRHPGMNQNPSLVTDIGSLAGLYRTVFWMMGRKARYGRLWPPEAEMSTPYDVQAVAPPPPVIQTSRPDLVEAATRD
ncbi:MAG: hypothetical protein ACRDFT_09245 [bacterium]